MGFVQQPLVLNWQQAPPASTHSRVRSILTTAAAAGLGCLDLKTKCQVTSNMLPHLPWPDVSTICVYKCSSLAQLKFLVLLHSLLHYNSHSIFHAPG